MSNLSQMTSQMIMNQDFDNDKELIIILKWNRWVQYLKRYYLNNKMGNQNCAQIYELSEQNQSYGDFKIIKDNNKTLALIQKTLQNDQLLKIQVQSKLQTRLKLKSNHLVKLQKYQINKNKYSTEVQMYYEFIGKTLQDRYRQKMNDCIQFTQRQLFNIIYGVEEGLEELNKYDIRHGCINLITVLCQGNFYKITDVSSTTFVKSYDLVRRGCRNQFLSQKLLTNLQYRSLQPYYQIEDDLFSLGMIILTLVSKVMPNHFYVWKEKTCTAEIRWDCVETSIKRVEKMYSSKLSKKVKELIGFSQELDKSLDTNSTTANNALNISYQHQNELNSISHSISTLDKDIDRILYRVNIHTSLNNTLGKQQLKNDLVREKQIIGPSSYLMRVPNKSFRVLNHNISVGEKQQESKGEFSFYQDKFKDSY